MGKCCKLVQIKLQEWKGVSGCLHLHSLTELAVFSPLAVLLLYVNPSTEPINCKIPEKERTVGDCMSFMPVTSQRRKERLRGFPKATGQDLTLGFLPPTRFCFHYN